MRIWTNVPDMLWFQFQNGTIKSEVAIDLYKKVSMFQFQNGTIKSGYQFLICQPVF